MDVLDVFSYLDRSVWRDHDFPPVEKMRKQFPAVATDALAEMRTLWLEKAFLTEDLRSSLTASERTVYLHAAVRLAILIGKNADLPHTSPSS